VHVPSSHQQGIQGSARPSQTLLPFQSSFLDDDLYASFDASGDLSPRSTRSRVSSFSQSLSVASLGSLTRPDSSQSLPSLSRGSTDLSPAEEIRQLRDVATRLHQIALDKSREVEQKRDLIKQLVREKAHLTSQLQSGQSTQQLFPRVSSGEHCIECSRLRLEVTQLTSDLQRGTARIVELTRTVEAHRAREAEISSSVQAYMDDVDNYLLFLDNMFAKAKAATQASESEYVDGFAFSL
jgi:hypothetical protein